MITGAILLGLAWLVTSLLALLPDVPVPDWLDSISNRLTGLFSGHGALVVMQFVPGGLLVAVAGGVAAVIGVSFLVRIGRIAISHITGGGGAL